MSDSGVSVVLSTYNGARHIGQQLRSVLHQSAPPVEVLVCDDGSTDDTLAIVELMATESSVPIRIIRNPERLGFADNFLHGAELASGRFVAFCDQDDVWRSDKLATAVSRLLEHDAVLAAHAVGLINASGERVGDDTQGISAARVVEPLTEDPWRKFFGFTLVVERALLAALPPEVRGADTHAPEKPLSHDRWACFLGFSLGRVVLIDEPLADYRQHDAQLYGSGRRRVGRLERERSRWRHLRSSVATVGVRSRFLAEVCRSRAEMLATARWPDTKAVARAAAYWRHLADRYGQRAPVHADAPLPSRALALRELVRDGVYRPSVAGGLGRRALVQDASSLAVRRRSTGPMVRRTTLDTGSMTSQRVIAVVATAGRPHIVGEVLQDLLAQTRPLDAIVISVPDDTSLPIDGLPDGVTAVTGTRGAAAQRNAGLLAEPHADIAFFFDDDSRVRADYVEHALTTFDEHPEAVGLSGRVLLDGSVGPEIPTDRAVTALQRSYADPIAHGTTRRKTLYGCNFAYRIGATSQRFDDRLPLYSWLEDHDLARRLLREGVLLTADDCVIVHRGAESGGRQSHVRLGYSQVMNAAYFVRKGSFPISLATDEIGRRVIKNLLKSVVGAERYWRRERLRGNWIAGRDVLRGRFTPERILDL